MILFLNIEKDTILWRRGQTAQQKHARNDFTWTHMTVLHIPYDKPFGTWKGFFCNVVFFATHIHTYFAHCTDEDQKSETDVCSWKIVKITINWLETLIHIYRYTRETATFGGVFLALRGTAAFGTAFEAPSAAFLLKKKEVGRLWRSQMVLHLPQGHEDSEYVLSFEIGQRESGFYSARTDTQTHPVPY